MLRAQAIYLVGLVSRRVWQSPREAEAHEAYRHKNSSQLQVGGGGSLRLVSGECRPGHGIAQVVPMSRHIPGTGPPNSTARAATVRGCVCFLIAEETCNSMLLVRLQGEHRIHGSHSVPYDLRAGRVPYKMLQPTGPLLDGRG